MNQKPIIIQGEQASGKSTLIRAMYKNPAFVNINDILKAMGDHHLTGSLVVEVNDIFRFNLLIQAFKDYVDIMPVPFIIETNQDFGHPGGFSLIKCENVADNFNFQLIL